MRGPPVHVIVEYALGRESLTLVSILQRRKLLIPSVVTFNVSQNLNFSSYSLLGMAMVVAYP